MEKKLTEKDRMSEAASVLGKKGGKVRARKLSPERRREIATAGARAKWDRATT